MFNRKRTHLTMFAKFWFNKMLAVAHFGYCSAI